MASYSQFLSVCISASHLRFVLPQLCDKIKLPSRSFIVSMYLCIWLPYVFVFVLAQLFDKIKLTSRSFIVIVHLIALCICICTGGWCDKIRLPICSLFSLMTDFNLARIIFLASPPCQRREKVSQLAFGKYIKIDKHYQFSQKISIHSIPCLLSLQCIDNCQIQQLSRHLSEIRQGGVLGRALSGSD